MGERSPQERREKCPTKIGKYLVGGIIGKGGFGSVYRAIEPERGFFVAIKQMTASGLSPGDLGSVEMEIALLCKLKHRNIVKYIDTIRTDQHLDIVLEFIEGGSLRSIVKKVHVFPESLCAIYTLQILNGLAYLHSQGVVHRDIKGANVLVTKRGTVKLADFGVATKLSEVDNSKRCVVGTPYWMAPEIIEMSPPTPACDLWSVGGTVVEMITESPPYFHLPQVSALYRIVSDPHPPLPDCISPALESFLLACWEKNPSLRAGAGELLEHEWIQAHKRHTIAFSRSRKMMHPPAEKEEDDDDEELDEEAEAVETFMATMAGSKDISAAFLTQGAASAAAASGPQASAAAAAAAASAAGPASPVGSSHNAWASASHASPPSVAGSAMLVVSTSGAGSAATNGGSCGGGAQARSNGKDDTEVGFSEAAAAVIRQASAASRGQAQGDGAGGTASAGPGEAQQAAGIAEAHQQPQIHSHQRERLQPEQFLPQDQQPLQQERQLHHQPDFDQDDLQAGIPRQPRPTPTDLIEVDVAGTNTSSMGEYNFFFLDYFQKMDRERTVNLQGATAMGTSDKDGTSAANPAPGEGSVQATSAKQPPSPPRRLASRGGRWQHALARDGDETPLPPPPQESAYALAPNLGSMAVAGLGGNPLAPPGPGIPAGQRDAAEIKQLLGRIRPFEEPEVLVDVCKRLTQLLQQKGNEEGNLHLLMQHGAVPIVEMLQVTDPTLLRAVLKMVNQLADGSQAAQEIFATVGLIPGVIKFARSQDLPHLRREAAHFISRLCNTSARSLQMLVACGGLEALADLVAHDYYSNRDLVWLALDALVRIFDSSSQNGRTNDFCRILAKHGLCGHLCVLIDTLASDIHERAAQYLKVVVELLLFFAKAGDAIVKVYMAKGPVLEGFLSSLEFLPQDLAVHIFKTFKWLAQEPSVLNMLENAGVVPVLATMLASLSAAPPEGSCHEGSGIEISQFISQDACSQCLLALFYSCKLSRPRQEQAALAGAAPLLQGLVERDHPLKVWAFVMLCNMTSASLATRRILWSHGCLELLVRSLLEPTLQTFALEALVGWIGVKEHRADWCVRLEGVLLQDGGEFVPQLLALFGATDLAVFMQVLEQLLKLTRLSVRLNAALAASDDFFQVIAQRLQPHGLQRRPSVVVECAAEGVSEGVDGELAKGFGPAEVGLLASPAAPPSASVAQRRLESKPGELFVQDDDVVRARKNLLRLLLQICQGQDHTKLRDLCVRHELPALIKAVLLEEQRRERVILCDFASQLLELFRRALSVEPTP